MNFVLVYGGKNGEQLCLFCEDVAFVVCFLVPCMYTSSDLSVCHKKYHRMTLVPSLRCSMIFLLWNEII